MNKSTSSHVWYKVGILEKVVEGSYINADGERVSCDMSIVYDGSPTRNYITHSPGHEIYECLPVDSYPERNKAIGRRKK